MAKLPCGCRPFFWFTNAGQNGIYTLECPKHRQTTVETPIIPVEFQNGPAIVLPFGQEEEGRKVGEFVRDVPPSASQATGVPGGYFTPTPEQLGFDLEGHSLQEKEE
jgi:hypothetical protein